jgi:hypothetical protein
MQIPDQANAPSASDARCQAAKTTPDAKSELKMPAMTADQDRHRAGQTKSRPSPNAVAIVACPLGNVPSCIPSSSMASSGTNARQGNTSLRASAPSTAVKKPATTITPTVRERRRIEIRNRTPAAPIIVPRLKQTDIQRHKRPAKPIVGHIGSIIKPMPPIRAHERHIADNEENKTNRCTRQEASLTVGKHRLSKRSPQ